VNEENRTDKPYPGLTVTLGALCALLTGFFLILVYAWIPTLVKTYEEIQLELPHLTIFFLNTSSACKNYWIFVIPLLFIVQAGLIYLVYRLEVCGRIKTASRFAIVHLFALVLFDVVGVFCAFMPLLKVCYTLK